MIAIRQIQEVKSGAVTVALPVDFHAKQVEIIVLPVEESNGGAQSWINDEEFEAAADLLADEFAARVKSTTPALSDYAVSRAGIYEDHP